MIESIAKALSSGYYREEILNIDISQNLRDSLNCALIGKYHHALEIILRNKDVILSKLNEKHIALFLVIRYQLALSNLRQASEIIKNNHNHLPDDQQKKLQARFWLSSGNQKSAVELLQSALINNPNDWEALSLLAALGGSESEKLFQRSLEIFPHQADALRNRAVINITQGNFLIAIENLKRSLEIRPTYTYALEMLHPLLMQLAETKTLSTYFENIPTELWSEKLWAQYLELLWSKNELEKAWNIAQKIENKWQQNYELLLYVAATAQKIGKPSKARSIYKNISENAPDKLAAHALNNLALQAVSDADTTQALEYLTFALKKNPNDIDLKLHYSELLLRSGNQLDAISELELLDKFENQFNLDQKRRWLQAKSRYEQILGNYETALQHAQKARVIAPTIADSWLQEASILSNMERTEEAIEFIKVAEKKIQNPRELRDALIAYLLKQFDLDGSVKLINHWLADDPNDIELLSKQAAIEIEYGHFSKAEQKLIELEKINPYRAKISLAKFYLQRNRAEDAYKIAKDLINSEPQNILPFQIAAKALQQLERWEDALSTLNLGLEKDPDRFDLLSDLVEILVHQGHYERALLALEEKISKRPSIMLIKLMMQVIRKNNDWQRALLSVQKIEKIQDTFEVQIIKSRILRRLGNKIEALQIVDDLIQKDPKNIKIREAFIRELLIQEKFQEAKQQAYELVNNLTDSPKKLLQLTSLLVLAEYPDIALDELEKNIHLWEDNKELKWRYIELLHRNSNTEKAQEYLEALVNESPKPHSANLLERASNTALKHCSYVSATNFAKLWCLQQPKNNTARWQLFLALEKQNQFHLALDVINIIKKDTPFDRRLRPAEAKILTKMSRYKSAELMINSAIDIEPTNYELHDQRLMIKTSMGDYSSFDNDLRELNRLRGENSFSNHHKYFFNINCHPNWDEKKIFSFYKAWYKKSVEPDLPPVPSYPAEQFDKNKKIKIGYVSGDFKTHAVAYFSEPLLMHHDRESFEVFLIATHNPIESDTITRRFQSYANHWINAYGMTDGELYRKVRGLSLDILVDLSGHTSGNRLSLFSKKPVPLQFSAIFGAGQTTGIERIDYLLCDQECLPLEHSEHISEKRAAFPFTGLPFKPNDDYLEPKPLPFLSDKTFTFGCVTRPVRINPSVCRIWGEILAACPNAQLIFEHISYSELEVQSYFTNLLIDAGAKSEQIKFRNTRPYWSLFHHIDVLLDPWPAGSGTVGSDALWMERLTITLRSRPIMGRIMTAQLTALGLDEHYVCNTLDEYKKKAIYLANTENGRLQLCSDSLDLRERLKNSVLMDYKNYGREAAKLYRNLWIECCDKAYGNSKI